MSPSLALVIGLAGVLPFQPQVDRLDNGLTVVTVTTDAPGLLAYYTIVRTGSRDEVEAGRSGFAHFFEHMMFRGTERYPAAKYGKTLQSIGADNNAYTTGDYTAYHTVAPSSALAQIVDMEADRFQHLAYSEGDFKTEAGAVLGEYNKAVSSPWMKMWESLSETAFTAHTYRHTTLGYIADIKAMPEGFDYAKTFFKRHYVPSNTTLLVVGDVKRAEVLALAKKHYGAWKLEHDAPKVPAEPEQTEGRSKALTWPSPTPAMAMLAWRVPAYSSKSTDSAARDVAGELLFGKTSALNKALVLEQQKVLAMEPATGWHRRDAHVFLLELKYKDPKETQGLVDEVQKAIGAAAGAAVDAKALEAVKSNLRYGRLMKLDSVGRVAGYLAGVIGLSGDVGDAERYFERLAAVSVADVQRIAAEQLTEQRRTVITLAHQPKAEAKASAKKEAK